MYQKKKYFLGIVCLAVLLFSVFYIAKYKEYMLTKIEDIQTDENYLNIQYEKVEPLEGKDILGILTIEKINLKATAKGGSTRDILKDYIGHITETAQYDGNVGLAAHNRWNQYSYFARLNELEKGDTILYQTKFNCRKYRVIKKQVIYDTDWSCFQNTTDNRLTMITCIADKPNQRLCVQAVEED